MAAEQGSEPYRAFFASLTPEQRKGLAGTDHEANKAFAAEKDKESEAAEMEEFRFLRESLGDAEYFRVLGLAGFERPEQAKPEERLRMLEQLRATRNAA